VVKELLDVKLLDTVQLSLDVKIFGIERSDMYPEPHVHQQIAAARVELLRASWGAPRAREPWLRRRLGLALVALGLRLADWPRTPSETRFRSSRA
jgi:hypothetical protein